MCTQCNETSITFSEVNHVRLIRIAFGICFLAVLAASRNAAGVETRWRLTIPGYTPNTGVLIISPEGGLSLNNDNVVSYQADGDGWILFPDVGAQPGHEWYYVAEPMERI